VKELCRKHGFSHASFYMCENARLKKLLAEALLDKEALQVLARGKR
jgi:putative transposase